MSDRDEHLVVLQGIWTEMKTLNTRVNGTNERVDGLTQRVDGLNQRVDLLNDRVDGLGQKFDDLKEGLTTRLDRLERRQAETEIRISTELVAVVGAVHEVRDVLKESRLDRHRLDNLEHRVEALEKTSKPRG